MILFTGQGPGRRLAPLLRHSRRRPDRWRSGPLHGPAPADRADPRHPAHPRRFGQPDPHPRRPARPLQPAAAGRTGRARIEARRLPDQSAQQRARQQPDRLAQRAVVPGRVEPDHPRRDASPGLPLHGAELVAGRLADRLPARRRRRHRTLGRGGRDRPGAAADRAQGQRRVRHRDGLAARQLGGDDPPGPRGARRGARGGADARRADRQGECRPDHLPTPTSPPRSASPCRP